MEKVLAGKVAVVTGASRGIGRATAIRLGRMGANVVVHYGTSRQQAEEVVAAIQGAGQQARAMKGDMRNMAELRQLFSQVIDEFERLDILVNNAGMLINKPLEDITEQEYDELMRLNLKSVFFACQEAARRMADGGRIINISSTVTKMMFPGYSLYGASKAAVEQVTRVLAKELGVREITVNAVSPGPVDTALFRKGKSEAQIVELAGMAAFGRIGAPEDIADAVSLLVREEAGWITGQCICANGGMAG